MRVSTVLCGAGLGLGVIATYVLIALTPSLLAHHSVLLEALNGSTTAIVTGGALARVGRVSLVLVALAPLVTVVTYDVFYWWAGRLWGSQVAELYARHNPRAARWIDRAEGLVRRGGIWTLVVGYYLPVPNVLIYLSCGVSGMALGTFIHRRSDRVAALGGDADQPRLGDRPACGACRECDRPLLTDRDRGTHRAARRRERIATTSGDGPTDRAVMY